MYLCMARLILNSFSLQDMLVDIRHVRIEGRFSGILSGLTWPEHDWYRNVNAVVKRSLSIKHHVIHIVYKRLRKCTQYATRGAYSYLQSFKMSEAGRVQQTEHPLAIIDTYVHVTGLRHWNEIYSI